MQGFVLGLSSGAVFAFRLDTVAGSGVLTPRNPSVIALEWLVKVNKGWVARFQLRKIS